MKCKVNVIYFTIKQKEIGGKMMFTSRVTDILKIEYPVVQAGMAGAITTPELVAAVSNSGGIGT
ncbi:nitronate monooxygenase, partial [Peribacillus frigoritolerans]|uniref:nitronate monooxygenase n=1 Tax=Peribacillus frigoritolerans TaxID=450367 RepID=UPI002B24D032